MYFTVILLIKLIRELISELNHFYMQGQSKTITTDNKNFTSE